MQNLKASQYTHCPSCFGSFSFKKPLANKCCWCNKVLPFVRKVKNQDSLLKELVLIKQAQKENDRVAKTLARRYLQIIKSLE